MSQIPISQIPVSQDNHDNSFGLLNEDTGPERWADIETKALINLWGDYLEEIRKGGRNSGVFRKIALDLQSQLNRSVPRTPKEVKYKIENLKKQYNRQIRHVKRLGIDNPSAIPWRFFKFIDRFLSTSNNESRESPSSHQNAFFDENGYFGGKFPLQVLLHTPSDNQSVNAFRNVLGLGSNPLGSLSLGQFATLLSENQSSNSQFELDGSMNVEDQSNESENDISKLEESNTEIEYEEPDSKAEHRSSSPATAKSSDMQDNNFHVPSWLEESCLSKLNLKQLELDQKAKELADKCKELQEREVKVKQLEERLCKERLEMEEREDRIRRERREWEERLDRERREWEERQERSRREWEQRQDRLRWEWEDRQDRYSRDKPVKRMCPPSLENGPC